jgi:hypothetical protein
MRWRSEQIRTELIALARNWRAVSIHQTHYRELLYDWRFTTNQFVLATSILRLMTVFFQLNICGYSPYVTSSLTRGWVCNLRLLLVLASLVILRSESSGPHFTLLDAQLSQIGGPSPRIYIPQKQGGPVIPPGTGFPFRRLLRLAGLRWM